jgi:hypothetical protein
VRDGRGRFVEHKLYWDDSTYPLARPVTITCRTKRLFDRGEFRDFCDRHGTSTSISAALED